jgi:hypothetical protein
MDQKIQSVLSTDAEDLLVFTALKIRPV